MNIPLNLDEIIYNKLIKIFNEASNGRLEIDSTDIAPYTYNVDFLVRCNDEKLSTFNSSSLGQQPVLEISSIDQLIQTYKNIVLDRFDKFKEEYYDLKEEELVEMIIATTFFNMTYYDFSYPIQYLETLSNSSPLKEEYNININGEEFTFKVSSRLNSLNLETIDRMIITIHKDNQLIGILPYMNYSIKNNVAYIKNIQSKDRINDIENDVARLTPKVSGGANKHLRNVTPVHLLSLVVAIKTLEKNGIEEIKFPTYLPIRYHASINTAIRRILRSETRDDEEIKNDIALAVEEANNNQYNITNKFINTVLRFVYHFDNYEVTDYGDDSSYLTIKKMGPTKEKEDLLHRIMNCKNIGIKKE